MALWEALFTQHVFKNISEGYVHPPNKLLYLILLLNFREMWIF